MINVKFEQVLEVTDDIISGEVGTHDQLFQMRIKGTEVVFFRHEIVILIKNLFNSWKSMEDMD